VQRLDVLDIASRKRRSATSSSSRSGGKPDSLNALRKLSVGQALRNGTADRQIDADFDWRRPKRRVLARLAQIQSAIGLIRPIFASGIVDRRNPSPLGMPPTNGRFDVGRFPGLPRCCSPECERRGASCGVRDIARRTPAPVARQRKNEAGVGGIAAVAEAAARPAVLLAHGDFPPSKIVVTKQQAVAATRKSGLPEVELLISSFVKARSAWKLPAQLCQDRMRHRQCLQL
jgi:hypothetical protein